VNDQQPKDMKKIPAFILIISCLQLLGQQNADLPMTIATQNSFAPGNPMLNAMPSMVRLIANDKEKLIQQKEKEEIFFIMTVKNLNDSIKHLNRIT
jgi:hypothetical protein